jgi:cysteine synthase
MEVSPTLSTGHKVGHHRIQGVSDQFIPAIVDLDELDHVIAVNDGDAILMAQKLAADLGLAVGISSGANFIAALMAQNELATDAVGTVTCHQKSRSLISRRSGNTKIAARPADPNPPITQIRKTKFNQPPGSC